MTVNTQPEKQLAKQVNPCGTCRACCTFHKIEPLGDEEQLQRIQKHISNGETFKPAGVPCQNLNPNKMHKGGCLIYDVPDKPTVCSTYLCAYAMGALGNDIRTRPDNLGAIFDILEEHKLLRVVEIDKNALNRQYTKRVMWGAMQAVKQTFTGNSGWKLSIIPLNLVGTELASYTVITPAEDLSIGKHNDNKE